MRRIQQPECLVKVMSKGYTTTQGFYDSPVMLGANRIKPERRKQMPIEGLTDINRPPRQGMLRLGIKKQTKGGKDYPSEVDYFILDPETPDEVEKKRLIDKFHEGFGEKPKTIAISLPAPVEAEIETVLGDSKRLNKFINEFINEVFPQNYKRYGKNTSLKCIGDGKTAVCTEEQFVQGLEITGKDKKGLPTVKCQGRNCKFAVTNEKATAKECKATATLSVDIWPLGGIGVWQVTTGSFNSIVNINSCIRSIITKYGRAHALPLILERRPQIATYQGKKTTHYTLHINTDKSITEMVRTAQIAPERVLIEAYGTEVAALPAPEEIMDSETAQESDKPQGFMPKANWPGDVCNGFPEKVKVLDAEATQEIEKTVDDPTHKLLDSVKGTAPDDSDKLAEYDKTTEKVVAQFSGEVASEDSKSEKDEEFLDGLKKDAKAELDSDGNQDPKIVFPKLFPKFMAFCKAQLEAAGKGDMYRDAFHLYSVKTAADLEKDLKKQADMRIYLEGLVEEEIEKCE